MNRLVVIHYQLKRIAFLNVSRDEAIRRWCELRELEDTPERRKSLEELGMITEFEFEDQFFTTGAWIEE